ncbi:MAG: ABC transporter substrate-binding protein [Planctomycetota bacterium]|nr:ABC transporter substrate-binding protein [Planctomycetota bacterium]
MMFNAARKLLPGFALIFLISAVLLYSDWAGRERPGASDVPLRVALVQYTSQSVIDQSVQGTIEALGARGYVDGARIRLQRFNAQGDLPTANAIAREVVAGQKDLVITATTISLQTVANANQAATKTKHVFGTVSDPFHAGVGIDKEHPLDHPKWLTGYGSMPPVLDCFLLARQMNPALRKVGVAWNPTEANSEAAVKLARAACTSLRIELVEANVTSSNEVAEGIAALTTRGVQAIWVGSDVAVLTAIELVITAASRARIPVFTVIPPTAQSGALFDLGANYHEIGMQVGNLAADVLDGKDPATIPVENRMPKLFVINRKALAALPGGWTMSDELLKQADVVIELDGRRVARQQQPKSQPTEVAKPASGKKFQVDLIEYVDTPNVDLARDGLMAGFLSGGMVMGRDFDLRHRSAQGDMATLATIVDAATSAGTDLLISATTPALQMCLQRGRGTPLVFTLVADPLVAGAGKTYADHLPFVTGSYLPAAHQEAIDILRVVMPNLRRIGTLFVPAEVNSVFYKDDLLKVALSAGLTLIAVGVSSTGEVADAARALCSQDIDAFCQISDNLSGASFAAIAQAAKQSRKPLISFASGHVSFGALMTVARDFHDNGELSGRMAVRVLRGEPIAQMPFAPVTKLRIVINNGAAAQFGITFPTSILDRANEVIR